MKELIPEKQMILADLKKNYGNTKLADLTVNHVSTHVMMIDHSRNERNYNFVLLNIQASP
jgi:hypothetical protein